MTAERKRYGVKGTLREECMRDRAELKDFPALESDWRELFRWLISVSGDIPYFDREERESGRLSSLWENHVLTVLADILRKDLCGYVDSFVEGRGTSAQEVYTDRLQSKFSEWIQRLDAFLRQSRSAPPGSPSAEVARLLHDRLEAALPQGRALHRGRFGPRSGDTNRPYFRMLGAVKDIQQHAADYIARIEAGGDLDASLALLLTFIRNYCLLADRFNRRFEGWAGFYRKNILNDTPKEAVQDRTLLVVEPERGKGAAAFPLPAGTGFTAGKKADGSDLVYATAEKEYIVPARIRTVCSLFPEQGRLLAVSVGSGEQSAAPLFAADNPAAVPFEYGWLLFSRSLVLSEGRRRVRVRFDFRSEERMPDLSPLTGDSAAFRLQTGGSEGWTPREYVLSCERGSLRFDFTIEESGEAPAPCTQEVHGIATAHPAVRILFADRERTAILRGLEVESIRIRTEVEGIRNFTLIGESGPMDPTRPFYPFGPLGERDSRFVFGHEEAALKPVTAVRLKGVWNKLPEGGFGPIYRNYHTDEPVGDSSFMVRCAWQDGGGWHEFGQSPRPLFRTEASGAIAERADFAFDCPADNLAENSPMPYRRDSKGFYRMVLSAPAIGFGTNAYYTLFAEVTAHNSRVKEKHRRPLPGKPQVPLLADMTFGYRSEEVLDRENGGIYRIDGVFGYEECRDNGRPPVFLPDTDAPSLMVGLDGMGGTGRVRLYFNLRPAALEEMPVAEQPSGALRICRYAGGGLWCELSPEEILCEETEGFARSGFIELKARKETAGGSLWLRFSFAGGRGPEGMVLDGLFLNCIRVQAADGDGTPLPAGTAVAPLRPDSRIRSVFSFRPGSGGKPAETEAAASVRQRIRIATRNRAVCGRDYKQLLLERFPEAGKVCCVSPDGESKGVRIVVFPKPEAERFPFLPGWKRAEMEAWVRRCAPPFAEIKVVNPVYEALDVRFGAMLKRGVRDAGEVKRRTKRRIRIFFMAWYTDGTLPDLGVRYSHRALLSRIGNDACMERVEYLKIEREGAAVEPDRDGDIFYEAADRCGILYVRSLAVEIEEYRPGVERAEIGADFTIG